MTGQWEAVQRMIASIVLTDEQLWQQNRAL